jgi:hypothetical protein
VHHLPSGETVFAGQRREGFYVDLGAIFDLGDLRPFQNLHLSPSAAAVGVNATKQLNVHTIALQVPKKTVSRRGVDPTDVSDPHSVIGVWASASRQKALMHESDGRSVHTGPWMQVSRLGNPLFNEVIVPMGDKDRWNALHPKKDSEFLNYVLHPELAALLPILYPGVFLNLAGLSAPRADLEAILLTGIPWGIIPGFQNFTGTTPADVLRLNMAISPASSPNIYGILGGDLAGYPNGRRVSDDVVTIELRAVAGATYPLVNSSYTADGAAGVIQQGITPGNVPPVPYLSHFPYLNVPLDGFDVPS